MSLIMYPVISKWFCIRACAEYIVNHCILCRGNIVLFETFERNIETVQLLRDLFKPGERGILSAQETRKP